jgi:hypothetical protein
MKKVALALGATFMIFIASCSSTGTGTTPAQVIADLNQAASAINGVVPQLVALPNGLTQQQATTILSDVAQAQSALATVSASTALDVSLPIMQRVFGGLNTAVQIVEAVPMAPQDKTIVVAAGILLASVESYLNSTMPAPPVVTAPAPPASATAQARATIQNGGRPTH